ncbi:MAG: hypothetical protein AAFR47_18625 [Pseudomonadota bacterium]
MRRFIPRRRIPALRRVRTALAAAVTVGLSLVAAPSLAAPGQTMAAQIAAAEAAAAQFADLRAARRAGWRPFGGEAALMGRHFNHPRGPDYVHGDRIDFAKPSNLVYAKIGGRDRLVALAYVVRIAPGEPLPEGFAGRQDIWHVHNGTRFLSAIRETKPLAGAVAGRWFTDQIVQKDGRTNLAMVHLWLIPNPKGRFASHNPTLAYLDLGLPPQRARDMDTARGLALIPRRGCDTALDAELWLSGASGSKARQIKSICRSIAADLRRGGQSLSALEASAREGWQRLEMTRDLSLTPAERRRMGAFVEDGPGICR